MIELIPLVVLALIVVWALRPAITVIRWILGFFLALIILSLLSGGVLFPELWAMLFAGVQR